jgi:very-short-patch-repair endonuclease
MPRRRSDDAVALRYRGTEVERKLWYDLRGRRFLGWKFRRQHAIGPFIADFACIEAKLVIELDGGQHVDSARDERRTAYLESQGWSVLRFWNNEIIENYDGVLERIAEVLRPRLRPGSP